MTRPRSTPQRNAVRAALARGSEFRSAQELHDELSRAGVSISLATVYRTLAFLLDSREIDSVVTESGEITYRRCSSGHHHHLICRDCGHAVEVSAEAVEEWAEAVARARGFTAVSHTVELSGLCAACSRD